MLSPHVAHRSQAVASDTLNSSSSLKHEPDVTSPMAVAVTKTAVFTNASRCCTTVLTATMRAARVAEPSTVVSAWSGSAAVETMVQPRSVQLTSSGDDTTPFHSGLPQMNGRWPLHSATAQPVFDSPSRAR